MSGQPDKMAEKKGAPQVFSFLRLFPVFLYMVSFSNVHFKTMKKDYLWNTAHFLCQTNNPLCAGVDSITQLLSCVPRLKKLHLKMLWWCSVCERIPSVQETASLLKEYPNIVFNYCDHARIILNFSKNICCIFVTFPKSDRRRKCRNAEL